jgi:hypothetical protein
MDLQHDDAETAALLGLLTPIAKSWPSEYGLLANDLAIQVHGGYGYTRDFPVELLFRDNRLNPIHEGTMGIQAIDLLGRKILRDDGTGLAVLRRRMADCIARASVVAELVHHAETLGGAMSEVDKVIATLRETAVERVFDNATTFLRAFGHLVVGWLWLDQAIVAIGAGDGNDAFYAGKQRACRYFFESEMPKVETWLRLVGSCTDVASSTPATIF